MKKNHIAALLIAASIFLTIPAPSYAQNNEGPQVSTVLLKVVRNQDGSQSVITPKGDLAPLPGAGVSGDAAEIYMGSQGGFWYQDMSGQTVDLSAAVQALQARRQRATAHQVPQYAPQPYYPEQAPAQTSQTTQTTTQSTGSGALTAVGTAAAAGMGAMAGAAMSHNYYNAPYGTPMYYGAQGNPYYYNNNNERQTFSDLNANQQAVLYNKRKTTVNNQAEAVQHAQTSQQNRQDQYQTSQQNRQTQYQSAQQTRQTEYQNNQANRTQMAQEAQTNRSGSQHQENYQKQQQWYQQQVSQNPGRFQKSESNPFTAQQGGGGRFAEARSEGGGGRFGGGERASGRESFGGGGRFRRR